MEVRRDASKNSQFFELARLLVCFGHIASIIVNADKLALRLRMGCGHDRSRASEVRENICRKNA
jgi:hypothetical protein